MAITNSPATAEAQTVPMANDTLPPECGPRHDDSSPGSGIQAHEMIAYQGRLLPLERLLLALAELEQEAEEAVRTASADERDRHAEIAVWADCSSSALRNECMFCRVRLVGPRPGSDGTFECPCCGEEQERYSADASFCGIDLAMERMLDEGVELPVIADRLWHPQACSC